MSKSSFDKDTLGIELVPSSLQVQKPVQLFFVWCAANIGILGIVYGAIIAGFGLSFTQSLLAAVFGTASFALVGISAIAGKIGRSNTLTLSRAAFRKHGNIAPTCFCWINLMGWEVVNIVTGTLTLAALLALLGLAQGQFSLFLSLVIFAGLVFLVSMLGQSFVLALQKWIAIVFGLMTLLIVFYLLFKAQWSLMLSKESGSWTGFFSAISIIAAGTGISWGIAGADYSKDQSPSSSNKSIFLATLLGASLPLVLLILTGILLSSSLPDLASSENPIFDIQKLMPQALSIPYLATAVAGIVTIAVLSLYSASLNLLSIGFKIGQRSAVFLDSLLVLSLASYVLFVSKDFLDPFIGFLIFCGLFLAPLLAIFVIDFYRFRQQGYEEKALFDNDGVELKTVSIWLLSSLTGLMVSNTGFIDGPFAVGVFADSSLGMFLSFALASALYWIYSGILR